MPNSTGQIYKVILIFVVELLIVIIKRTRFSGWIWFYYLACIHKSCKNPRKKTKDGSIPCLYAVRCLINRRIFFIFYWICMSKQHSLHFTATTKHFANTISQWQKIAVLATFIFIPFTLRCVNESCSDPSRSLFKYTALKANKSLAVLFDFVG